jgi:hypothetical protein
MSFTILLISALLTPSLASTCFDYSCEALEANVCVQKYDSATIYINNDGCSCFVGIAMLTLLRTDDDGATIECYSSSSQSYDFSAGSDYDSYDCGVRDSQAELVDGSYPKICNDHIDCVLENGGYNSCYCSLDGNAYCVPDISSSIYDDYWAGCDTSDGDKILYGINYYTTYPLQVNSPSCAEEVLYELIYLTELGDRLNSAVVHGLLVLGGLLLC